MSDTLRFVIIFSGVWTLVGVVFLIIGIVMLNNRKKEKRNTLYFKYIWKSN